MNISYKWLKDYIPTELSAEQVAEALTSIGLETGSVDRVESIRGGLRGIVIGKVLNIKRLLHGQERKTYFHKAKNEQEGGGKQ